jgi:hypothetical protein
VCGGWFDAWPCQGARHKAHQTRRAKCSAARGFASHISSRTRSLIQSNNSTSCPAKAGGCILHGGRKSQSKTSVSLKISLWQDRLSHVAIANVADQSHDLEAKTRAFPGRHLERLAHWVLTVEVLFREGFVTIAAPGYVSVGGKSRPSMRGIPMVSIHPGEALNI